MGGEGIAASQLMPVVYVTGAQAMLYADSK